VLVRFPFSDLSSSKLRPAVVLAFTGRDDWILCQVTSNPYSDSTALRINESDFEIGSLKKVSYARPCKWWKDVFLWDQRTLWLDSKICKGSGCV